MYSFSSFQSTHPSSVQHGVVVLCSVEWQLYRIPISFNWALFSTETMSTLSSWLSGTTDLSATTSWGLQQDQWSTPCSHKLLLKSLIVSISPWRPKRFILVDTKQFQNCFKTVSWNCFGSVSFRFTVTYHKTGSVSRVGSGRFLRWKLSVWLDWAESFNTWVGSNILDACPSLTQRRGTIAALCARRAVYAGLSL